MVRPLSRKDIFYSGSVTNLREYQSQKSLTNYRNSVISLTKYERDAQARDAVSEVEKGEREYLGWTNGPIEFQYCLDYWWHTECFFLFLFSFSLLAEYDLCPCLVLPESFKSAISTMLDVSLLKDPVFMLIGISNVFGMAGLYVPFVYLVDAASLNVSKNNRTFLDQNISIFGRLMANQWH